MKIQNFAPDADVITVISPKNDLTVRIERWEDGEVVVSVTNLETGEVKHMMLGQEGDVIIGRL